MTKPKNAGNNGKANKSNAAGSKETPTKPPVIPEDTKPQEGDPAPTKPPIPEDTKPQEGDPAPTKPPIPEEERRVKEKRARYERAREVFATHSVEEIYFTADNQCFVNPAHARMNATAIKSEEVITVTRKEVK